MTDFTNLELSNLMLDMMCAENAIFVLVSANGDIITQTKAAKKLFDELPLRPIAEVLSASAATSLRTVLQTGESIHTIESIDSHMYRLEIRPCEHGALLYFMPTENLFNGLPAHTKYELSTALSRNFIALDLLKNKQNADPGIIESLRRNTLRIHREIMHLQMLENNTDLELVMNISHEDIVSLCVDLVSECKKAAQNRNIDIVLSNNFPKELIISFDKKLLSHAILNLLSNAILAHDVNRIEVMLYHKNHMVFIEILDNGNGIPIECIEEVGNEYLLHLDTQSFMMQKLHGTASGFGLSVVKRIINLHSGVFRVIRADESGSLVQIAFPDNLPVPKVSMGQRLEIYSLNVADTEVSVLEN